MKGSKKPPPASKKPGSPDAMGAKLNAIIALLLVQLGEAGREELLKKRRANSALVSYFLGLGLTNKELAEIFNTTESSISDLKARARRKVDKEEGRQE